MILNLNTIYKKSDAPCMEKDFIYKGAKHIVVFKNNKWYLKRKSFLFNDYLQEIKNKKVLEALINDI